MKMIDATKAMESIDEIVCTMSVCINLDYCNGMRAMKDMALHAIEEQPTVDAAPVVRCGECEHRKPPTDYCEKLCKAYVPDDFYCKYGERTHG